MHFNQDLMFPVDITVFDYSNIISFYLVSGVDESIIKGSFSNQDRRRILGNEDYANREIDGCTYHEITDGECAAAKKFFTWIVSEHIATEINF